jgi:hypothetical protein
MQLRKPAKQWALKLKSKIWNAPNYNGCIFFPDYVLNKNFLIFLLSDKKDSELNGN